MNYEESESWLVCAINHLGKRKGVFSFQWAETVAHEGKISGWRVAYSSLRIKSNLEKKIVIPVAFIYDSEVIYSLWHKIYHLLKYIGF